MDFDWIDVPFDLAALPPKDIEESFEDPFALKFLPDGENSNPRSARYFSLGKSLSGQRHLSASSGRTERRYRVIFARPMTPEEDHFYERKKSEEL